MNAPRLYILLGLAALTLAACSDVRESLGLGRNPPDEFSVVDRPPLSMPPDFGLRPPRPGAPRPQEVDMTQRADQVLFGGKDVTNIVAPASGEKGGGSAAPAVTASTAEKSLLDTTGGAKADPNIRDTLDREASDKVVGSEHLVEDLLWWKPSETPGTTVNAPAEAERIKEAREKDEPLNKTATPVIERDKSGWLGL